MNGAQRSRKLNDFFDEEEDGTPWLVTYADMVMLILVFFLLIIASSSIDLERLTKALASVQKTLQSSVVEQVVPKKIVVVEVEEEPEQIDPDKPVELASEESLEELLKRIQAKIKGKNLQSRLDARLDATKTKIIIRIKDNYLFSSGSARIQPIGYPLIDAVIEITRPLDGYKINIKGHTDDVPISTVQFPSNWELSAIRATSVLRYFIGQGIQPVRLTATGYGEILPLAENSTKLGRASNRRVEFILEKER